MDRVGMEIAQTAGVETLPFKVIDGEHGMQWYVHPWQADLIPWALAEEMNGGAPLVPQETFTERTRNLLGEFLTGDTDRHDMNYLWDNDRKKLVSIDFGGSMKESKFATTSYGTFFSSNDRFRKTVPEGRRGEIDVPALREIVAKAPQFERLFRESGAMSEKIDGGIRRLEALKLVLKTYEGRPDHKRDEMPTWKDLETALTRF
jgi:hypothetical protein